MSHLESSVAQAEFDFWEFVACAKCHASFASEDDAPPQIPFWITECGHIVCNNHLNVDQSCIQCGSQGIQIAPLQRQMEAPMSDWFRSAPLTIESLAFSTRFQIETLASLVRYYKRKCRQQHALLERMKMEAQQHRLLRKKYEELKVTTMQMKEFVHAARSRGSETSETLNNNRKRQMLDSRRSTHSNSSPRSGAAPPGPERLTLQPQLFTPRISRHVQNDVLREVSGRSVASEERPGSSRFAEHFAYDASTSGLLPTAMLSHAQRTSLRHSTSSSNPRPPSRQPYEDWQGLRPPSYATFDKQPDQQYLPPPSTTSSQIQMPPPPLPYSARSSSSRDSQAYRAAHVPSLRLSDSSESLLSKRFLPSSSSGRASTQGSSMTQVQTQRFVPATPSTTSRIVNASAPGSRRSSVPGFNGSSRRHGGQREAFVPQEK